MKGKTLKVIPVFIIVAFVWHNYFKKNVPQVAQDSTSKGGVVSQVSEVPIALGSVEKEKISEIAQSTGENCFSLHEEILQKNTADIYTDISLHPENYKPECFKLPTLKQDYKQACFGTNPDAIKQNCQYFIELFKSALVDKIYPDTLPTKDLPLPILVRKIQSKLNNFNKEEGELLKKLGEELITAAPDDSEALKLYIMSQISDFKADTFLPEGKLFPYLKKGAELNPNDQNFLEMYLFALSSGKEAVKKMNDYILQNPRVSLGYFYLAAAYWHMEKDRASTERSLRNALEIEAGNDRYAVALAKVMNPKMELGNPGIFTLVINSNYSGN